MANKDLTQMMAGQSPGFNTPAGFGSTLGEILGGGLGLAGQRMAGSARQKGMLESRKILARNIGISIPELKIPREEDYFKEWLDKNEKKILNTSMAEVPGGQSFLDALTSNISPEEKKAKLAELFKSLPQFKKDYTKLVEKANREYIERLNKELPTYEELLQISPLVYRQQELAMKEADRRQRATFIYNAAKKADKKSLEERLSDLTSKLPTTYRPDDRADMQQEMNAIKGALYKINPTYYKIYEGFKNQKYAPEYDKEIEGRFGAIK